VGSVLEDSQLQQTTTPPQPSPAMGGGERTDSRHVLAPLVIHHHAPCSSPTLRLRHNVRRSDPDHRAVSRRAHRTDGRRAHRSQTSSDPPRAGRSCVENKAAAVGLARPADGRESRRLVRRRTPWVGRPGRCCSTRTCRSIPGTDLLRISSRSPRSSTSPLVMVANPTTGPKNDPAEAPMLSTHSRDAGLTHLRIDRPPANTSKHISIEMLKQADGANLVHVLRAARRRCVGRYHGRADPLHRSNAPRPIRTYSRPPVALGVADSL